MILAAAYWPTHAMPLMIAILCLMAISYRYYSAFLAAKVAVLDDSRATPAMRMGDRQNYDPTSKWVLFGHHFAAISGAGPLIGPVLAAQFGYLPGLLWIVIGVCLGGAVQDFLVLAASIRRNGKSLAEIAREDIGRVAGTAAATAILFIIIIALAGLGKVVVKALGGEQVKYPAGSKLVLAEGTSARAGGRERGDYQIPAGAKLIWPGGEMELSSPFTLHSVDPLGPVTSGSTITLPSTAYRVVPGSSWGTFTIACTIPIALFIGFYMYRLRPGRVLEASIIGGLLTLGATVLGGWVAHQKFGDIFNLSASAITWLMALYGFIAAVLPVWVLLCPRDYLSSFLKIGTIALLVGGTILANPKLEAPAINHVFIHGGPTVPGNIFPFLFITIMCGAISGFHALVSSGTTPKMIKRESDARTIGYGAMLIEGLVGVVAMIAAATLPSPDYYAMNTDLDKVPAFHAKILEVGGGGGIEHIAMYEQNTQESLRGRTGGAVTLAVGMAHIFDQAAARLWRGGEGALRSMWPYWYHFAIMFEALFILTTIDAGTRIGRFLLQEIAGRVIHPKLGQTSWWPSAWLSTALIVLGWVYFISSSSMAAIWPMFGVANQMLAVIALAVVTAYLANEGRVRYVWTTVFPMLVVATTTTTAASQMLARQLTTIATQFHNPAGASRTMAIINAAVQGALISVMLICGWLIAIGAAIKVWEAWHRPSPAARRGFATVGRE
ncbi:MAG TPA: carbon starvation protein A [Humisphaera sp.]|jgi:carbon starvation protein|nr:carbon starvation protein A [Humisphaera sp.]